MLSTGKYFIGDPCYVIDDEKWDSFLEKSLYFNLFEDEDAMKNHGNYRSQDEQGGIFEFEEYEYSAFSTAFGDGNYNSNGYGFFPVDSGSLGAIPIELCHLSEEEIINQSLGSIVEFDKPFYCSSDNGTIIFGNVEIYTNERDSDNECQRCGALLDFYDNCNECGGY